MKDSKNSDKKLFWKDQIEVELIGHTNNMWEVLATAAAKCRGTRKYFGTKFDNLMMSLVENDEGSAIEHVVLNFELKGISTVAMTHITRHRIASHTWGSKRFMKPDGNFILPFRDNDKYTQKALLWGIDKIISGLYRAYNYLIDECKWRKDHARYILPMADTREAVVSFNLRSLRNFLKQRLNVKAQHEVRYIAWLMLQKVYSYGELRGVFKDIWEEYGELFPGKHGE